MTPADASLILEMARYAPLRTAIFSLGPPLWGVAQLVNAYVHGGPLLYVAAVAAVMTAFSILLTRYHAAVYKRTVLAERWTSLR